MRRVLLPAVLATSVLLTACSGADDEPYVFVAEPGVEVECMEHQTEPPGETYTDPEQADLARNLRVLRYYVQNGDKGYCDDGGPTDADRAWAQFYLDQTTNREPVAAILDAP